MIAFWLIGLFVTFVNGLVSTFDPHGNDFAFAQNTNILGLISYMMQANHFFPMDTYLAIAGLYFIIYGWVGTAKVVEVVINVVRGAGLRI